MKKFLLSLVFMAIAIASNAANYYLAGYFNNWEVADPNALFTEQPDGTYTLDYKGILGSGFKITTGSWSGTFGGTGILTIGKPYSLVAPGDNIELDNVTVTNPHLVFNPSASTLLITGETKEADFAFGLYGNIFGSGNWETIKMDKTDGLWTINKDITEGQFQVVKINTSANDVIEEYYALSENAQPSTNTPFSMELNGTGGKIKVVKSGEATFTYNPEDSTLRVVGDVTITSEFDTNYFSYFLTGSFNGWIPDNPFYKFEKDDKGLLVLDLENPLVPSDLFQITNGSWLEIYGGNGSPLVEGIEYICLKSNDYTISVEEEIKDPRLVFNLETLGLTITDRNSDDTNSVATIDAENDEPKYFNLQGLRVTNPENGIFIRVVNGKAQKIVK